MFKLLRKWIIGTIVLRIGWSKQISLLERKFGELEKMINRRFYFTRGNADRDHWFIHKNQSQHGGWVKVYSWYTIYKWVRKRNILKKNRTKKALAWQSTVTFRTAVSLSQKPNKEGPCMGKVSWPSTPPLACPKNHHKKIKQKE